MLENLEAYLGTVPTRGIVVAKHIGQAFGCAISFGLCGGIVGSTLAPVSLGPLVPYLVGSSFGFVFSSVGFWHREKQAAIEATRKYPAVIGHHLRVAFPGLTTNSSFGLSNLRDSVSIQSASIGPITWLILARQTAEKDISEIEQRLVDQIVDEYAPNEG
eukprot:m.4537 g.4537  ORF g.4537 m.4537 type:complete len:160 (+) comp3433_c0_seq1:135-614(+)